MNRRAGLQLCVEVNGIQQQCWSISEAGHFNWALANPILSTRFPSIFTFSIKNKLQEVKATVICRKIRFTHILLLAKKRGQTRYKLDVFIIKLHFS